MVRDSKGYTFIELTVVVVIIGVMISLSVPRIRYAILTDDLKSASRKMTGIIKNLRIDAVTEQESFFLHLDIESNKIWIDSEAMVEEERLVAIEKASSLPPGVSILDVWLRGQDKQQYGEAAIRFNKKGYVQEAVIHLGSEDDRAFTLILSPFLRKVEVLEGYVEFEDT